MKKVKWLFCTTFIFIFLAYQHTLTKVQKKKIYRIHFYKYIFTVIKGKVNGFPQIL